MDDINEETDPDIEVVAGSDDSAPDEVTAEVSQDAASAEVSEDSVSVTDEEADVEPAPEAEPTAETESEDADEAVASDGDAAAEAPPVEGDAVEGEAIDAEDLLEESAPAKPESPYDRPGKWYVVHTQSGYEKKVKQNLEARSQSMNMEARILEVTIPVEDVVEFKNGKKVVVEKKVFPGYLLVRCRLDDDSWYVIRNTPGVTGFVGQGNKPSPLPRRDVENFLQVKTPEEEAAIKKKPRLEYELSETVRVKEGPFADFSGEIVEINEDQLKVKVLVNIFGRETPVELDFSQVARL